MDLVMMYSLNQRKYLGRWTGVRQEQANLEPLLEPLDEIQIYVGSYSVSYLEAGYETS